MENVNSLHPGNPVNEPSQKKLRNHSKFNLSRTLYNTERFGELGVCFCEEGVPDDVIRFQSKHDLRTYSFRAPLMQDVKKNKDFFAVPMQAVLPRQWDRIYANPNLGDDVPADAYTAVENFDAKIAQFMSGYKSAVLAGLTRGQDYSETLDTWFPLWLKFLVTGEYFYSTGSLINVLGHNMTGYFGWNQNAVGSQLYKNPTYDNFFDWNMSQLIAMVSYFDFNDPDGKSYRVYCGTTCPKVRFYDANEDLTQISLRTFLDLLRDDPSILDTMLQHDQGVTFMSNYDGNDYGQIVYDTVYPSGSAIDLYFLPSEESGTPIDLMKLYAYQIVCAHFYTNDAVDYIYSAELYRENVSFVLTQVADAANLSFSWNGIDLQYDILSACSFTSLLDDLRSYPAVSTYFSLIFAWRKSLRFTDYFTGSRTFPLAVGDTAVDVNTNTNQVSIIEVVQQTQFARFLNAVNRTGRKISKYVSDMFGSEPIKVSSDPVYLGHISDNVYASEVENTGEAQQRDANSVTAVLRSNADRFGFEFHPNQPCIILGITYYDISRSYSLSTLRDFFHSDRFEMFNPYMQFIGDQPIYLTELVNTYDGDLTQVFGYQQRYMEYKQRFDRACGGFVNNLPGYAFIADNVAGMPWPSHIDPEFIRSKNQELDSFYVSLSGFSLGTYFHFIVKNVNVCTANRPMAYSPNLLQ